MKVLITGGAGFLGSHLVDRLVSEGHSVDVVDDLSAGRLANLAEARSAVRSGSGELRVHTLDARAPELEQLVARRQPEVVVLLAAPAERTSISETAGVVVGAAARVLAGGVGHGLRRVVLVAPTGVYGDATSRELPITESHPMTPRSITSAAYLAAFELLKGSASVGVEHVGLIISSVYGPRSRTGLVTAMYERLVAHAPIAVRGHGGRTRDLLFIDDAVDAIVRSMTRGSRSWINVGSGAETAIASLAKAVGIDTIVADPAPGDRQRIALSPARAAVQLGWAPFTPLATGLASTRVAYRTMLDAMTPSGEAAPPHEHADRDRSDHGDTDRDVTDRDVTDLESTEMVAEPEA